MFSSLFLSAQSLPAPPPSPTWTRSPRTQWTCPGTDPPTMVAPSWRATLWKRRRKGKSGWSAHTSPPQPPMPPSRGWWRERSTSSVSWRRTRRVPAIPARQPTPSLPPTSLVSWLFCLVVGFLFLFEILNKVCLSLIICWSCWSCSWWKKTYYQIQTLRFFFLRGKLTLLAVWFQQNCVPIALHGNTTQSTQQHQQQQKPDFFPPNIHVYLITCLRTLQKKDYGSTFFLNL